MRQELQRLLPVWIGLLVLLAMTVGASFVLSGAPSLAASLGIALAKAALVFWFFMRLRAEGGLVRLIALAAGAWFLLLLLLSFADYLMRPIWP